MTTILTPIEKAFFEGPIHHPQGARRMKDDSVQWRVWAPEIDEIRLVFYENGHANEYPMKKASEEYHEIRLPHITEGARYAYQLPDGIYPDPASRWQPEGVHKPSAVFSPETFTWSDQSWPGVLSQDLVIYELHVGVFTKEGTFEAIESRLQELKALGVTAIEIMPVAQFPGDRNWGYDGVYPYAVQNSYGGPRALQRLVDAAHREGLAVFLDVVYNHLGPEGNYLMKFGPYFTDRYRTPWGRAVNYDGNYSDAVRQFVIDNACMWVRDFHIDGLRLDAVHTIFDFGTRPILADLQRAVQQIGLAQSRKIHVIAETSQNDTRLIDPIDRHGYALDGVWCDDFHHSVHALLSGEQDGYYQDFGCPEHLAKAFNRIFVYDGCYSRLRRRCHGSPVEGRDRRQFVVSIQNHDQIGNRAQGDRSSNYLSEPAQRLSCGLLMFSPCVPLLFMGEEYAERRPFPFFCSFSDPELIEAVRRGRREEFAALEFDWEELLPDPQDVKTFESAQLTWKWPEGSFHAGIRQLYKDLLAARRHFPSWIDRRHVHAQIVYGTDDEDDLSSKSKPVLLIKRGPDAALLAVVNLHHQRRNLARLNVEKRKWLLSTEAIQYGGPRKRTEPLTDLYPYEMAILDRKESGSDE